MVIMLVIVVSCLRVGIVKLGELKKMICGCIRVLCLLCWVYDVCGGGFIGCYVFCLVWLWVLVGVCGRWCVVCCWLVGVWFC